MPNRSKSRDQTKCGPPGPPGWGLGLGLITHSHKNQFITEIEGIRISINSGDPTRALSSRMTLLGQSRKEDQKLTASIVDLRNKTRIRHWNVRTMFETGKAGQVAREMKRYKLYIGC